MKVNPHHSCGTCNPYNQGFFVLDTEPAFVPSDYFRSCLSCRLIGSLSGLQNRVSEWTQESSFCPNPDVFCMCFFCTLMFENGGLMTFPEHGTLKKLFDAYIFPQYSHISTQNLQYRSSYIAVISLEIGFRILFMTKKKLGRGDNFPIWVNISGKSVIIYLL